MKRLGYVLIGLTLVGVTSGWATPPGTMSYQGVLADDTGIPVADGEYTMTFAIYDTPADPDALWTEQHDAANGKVTVTNGIFNVILGKIVPLDLPFDAAYWLGVSVEGEAELSPRTELAGSPYAFRAAKSDTASHAAHAALADSAVTGGGGADADWVIAGDDMHAGVSGHVGIGTSTPEEGLHLQGEGVVTELIESTSADGTVRLRLRTTGGTFDTITLMKHGPDVTGEIDGIPLARAAQLLVSGDAGSLLLRQWSPNPIHLLTNNLERMRITGAGDVGIGTTTPAGKLDVAGTVRMTGFELPTGATPGHVLTTDATGLGSWEPAASGGDTDWTIAGDDIYRVNGRVGIGIATPFRILDVHGYVHFTGPVGIGTDNPVADLQVDGFAAVHGLRSLPEFGGLGVAVGPPPGVSGEGGDIGLANFQAGHAALAKNAWWHSTNLAWYRNKLTAGAFLQEISLDGDVRFKWTGPGGGPITWTDRMVIEAGGHVGIGTAAPSSEGQLTVSSEQNDNFGILVDAASTDGSEIGLHTATSRYSSLVKNAYYDGGWRRFSDTDGAFLQQVNPSGDVLCRTAPAGTGVITWSENLSMRTDGNVGIGTTNPTSDLHVIGDIHCTGTVTSDGASAPSYVLYDKETRSAIVERVAREVPADKQDGAVQFWNGEGMRMEIYLPEQGEFRDLRGNLLARL